MLHIFYGLGNAIFFLILCLNLEVRLVVPCLFPLQLDFQILPAGINILNYTLAS